MLLRWLKRLDRWLLVLEVKREIRRERKYKAWLQSLRDHQFAKDEIRSQLQEED